MQVFVRDNNVDQALRVLKKKMQREGVFREMRRRRFYEKPSEKATREKSDAIRRMRKLARKQAIRDGLIAAPPKKKKEDGKRPETPLHRRRAATAVTRPDLATIEPLPLLWLWHSWAVANAVGVRPLGKPTTPIA